MMLPVNKDLFTCYFDKTYKIGLGSILASNTNTTNALDDSSFNQKIQVEWGKYFKQSLNYNDNDPDPTNRNLHLLFTCVRADGSATVDTVNSGAEYHITNTVKYEDG